jgi:hypothetical protein
MLIRKIAKSTLGIKDHHIRKIDGDINVNDLVILHQKRSFESASLLVFSK